MMKSLETPVEQSSGAQKLHRGLGKRHIQLIAIGGAIGTGLFMGRGKQSLYQELQLS
ncbi:amino acid transporter [Xenorhabdus szentirmaii]|nr:amino acid transporter [Xenorhabdus szentirmaii]